jgi:hypothetical protein
LDLRGGGYDPRSGGRELDREPPSMIEELIAETERFLKIAQKYQEAGTEGSIWPCVHRAATKRASLDLTRKLAEFRRP